MIDDDVRSMVEGTPVAHLATILPDGGPHNVPVWVGMHGDRIAVLTGPDSRKARNLRQDPRVAISMTPQDDPFRSALIRGRVTEWLDGDAAWPVVDALATKYLGVPYPRGEERIVVLIEPERAVAISFG